MVKSDPMNEITRCVHIGLLCVQENPLDRPTMASIVVMLNDSSLRLPTPIKPAAFTQLQSAYNVPRIHTSEECYILSENEVSYSEFYAR